MDMGGRGTERLKPSHSQIVGEGRLVIMVLDWVSRGWIQFLAVLYNSKSSPALWKMAWAVLTALGEGLASSCHVMSVYDPAKLFQGNDLMLAGLRVASGQTFI